MISQVVISEVLFSLLEDCLFTMACDLLKNNGKCKAACFDIFGFRGIGQFLRCSCSTFTFLFCCSRVFLLYLCWKTSKGVYKCW